MSGYKYNYTAQHNIYCNKNDKIGMWVELGKSVSFYKNSILIGTEKLTGSKYYPVCFLFYVGDCVTMNVSFKKP
jgi:hypothetical protein